MHLPPRLLHVRHALGAHLSQAPVPHVSLTCVAPTDLNCDESVTSMGPLGVRASPMLARVAQLAAKDVMMPPCVGVNNTDPATSSVQLCNPDDYNPGAGGRCGALRAMMDMSLTRAPSCVTLHTHTHTQATRCTTFGCGRTRCQAPTPCSPTCHWWALALTRQHSSPTPASLPWTLRSTLSLRVRDQDTVSPVSHCHAVA